MTGATSRRRGPWVLGLALVFLGGSSEGCAEAGVGAGADAGLDAGDVVDAGAGDAGDPSADSGAPRDSGSAIPDAGNRDDAGGARDDAGAEDEDGPEDAGPSDAGEVDPCSLCSASEVCVSGACVFDDDPARLWTLEITEVRSQVPGTPAAFSWDCDCAASPTSQCIEPCAASPRDELVVGDADILLVYAAWHDGLLRTMLVENLGTPETSGTVAFSVPLVVRTGTLEQLRRTGVYFWESDNLSPAAGQQSLICGLQDNDLETWPAASLTLAQEAAHDGAPRITSVSSPRSISYTWSIVP